MRRPIEFEAAARARYASHDHYRLTPREAYVLRSAPIRGLRQPVQRRSGDGLTTMMWMVREENLSGVVEGLLLRGFFARRGGVGPAYGDLTAEGRAALEAGQSTSLSWRLR